MKGTLDLHRNQHLGKGIAGGGKTFLAAMNTTSLYTVILTTSRNVEQFIRKNTPPEAVPSRFSRDPVSCDS